MGTRFDLLIIDQDRLKCQEAWNYINSELQRLDQLFNRFDSASETSKIKQGRLQDDTIVFGAFDESRWSNEKYIFPLLPVRYSDYSYGADLHDIVCRNVNTSGNHHVLIILPSRTKIYNIFCSNISDNPKGGKRKIIRIYGNGQYGQGFKAGNMNNIYMNDIRSHKADIALELLAPVYDSHFNKIVQLNYTGLDVKMDSICINTKFTNIHKTQSVK